MKKSKQVRILRTGQESAILQIERFFDDENSIGEMQYSYDDGKKTEKYVFFLSLDELYSITREALKASSEKIEIKKPGSY